MKFKSRIRYRLPPTGPGVYGVGLDNRVNESKLSCRPPFCVQNLLKTNRTMPPIIHIIHPMLDVIVTGEIVGVLECHQLPIVLPVGGIIGYFVE